MARPSFRIKVTDERHEPLDYDLLAQFVLKLAAQRETEAEAENREATNARPGNRIPRQRRRT